MTAAGDSLWPHSSRRAGDRRLRLLAQAAGWALIDVDADGRVVAANDLVEQVTGYHPRELAGRRLSCLYPASSTADHRPPSLRDEAPRSSGRNAQIPGAAHALDQALAHGIHRAEGWQVRRDGSWFWAGCVVLAHSLQDARVSGFRVMIQDLTERRNHLAQLRAVADVNIAVRTGVSRDAVLGMIAQHTRELLGAPACTVMTLEAAGNLLIRAADGAAVRELQGTWVPVDDTAEGEALRNQQPLTLADLAGETRWQTSPLAALGLRSVLLVPVPGWGRPWGLIQVADDVGRRFTTEEMRTVGLFAAQVGIEVEHDQVYGELQQLATLTTPDAKPLPQTLDTMTYCVMDATGAKACAIYLLDSDGSPLLTASHGPAEILHVGTDSSSSPGVPDAAQAALAAQSPVVHDGLPLQVRRTTRRRGGDPVGRPAPTTTLVCVPLVARGATLGVLCSYRASGARPSKLELAYLSLIAGQAAAAVDSAKLWATAVEKAALEERARLARELHDSVSQALYGIALGARTARQVLARAPEQVGQPIDYILHLAEAGLAEVRALIFELRPEALTEEGLVAALTKQLAALHSRHGVATHAELGPEPNASMEVKRALYRITQEALQNVARHARAETVTVRLNTTATDLVLQISDDGVGFDPNGSFPGHLGLRSMRERITEIGGVMDITSAPGKGTTVTARGPLESWR
jgi:signal transduction histidine kinase